MNDEKGKRESITQNRQALQDFLAAWEARRAGRERGSASKVVFDEAAITTLCSMQR